MDIDSHGFQSPSLRSIIIFGMPIEKSQSTDILHPRPNAPILLPFSPVPIHGELAAIVKSVLSDKQNNGSKLIFPCQSHPPSISENDIEDEPIMG